MLFKKRAVVFMPFFFAAAALVGNSAEVSGAEDKPNLTRALSELHAASQTAIKVSDLADKRAKSDLVKAYARTVSSGNAQLNAKLMLIAQKQGIKVLPLDPKTEAGKSLSDRLKAETVMLGSLRG